MPRVTVLLPVRNQAASLLRAMESILQQQWRDLQLLVLDDGSQDGSGDVAKTVEDPRVVVYRSDRAVGLPAILNEGIASSDSEFVARMDADDWSHPRRLAAQLEYLDSHRDVAACGTAVSVVMPDGSSHVRRYPMRHGAIRARLLFENAVAHPSIMLRRSTLQRYKLAYDPAYPKSQDYDLWEHLSKVAKLANLGRPYLEYNVYPRDKQHSMQQYALADRIRWRQLEALGAEPTQWQWELHRALCVWDPAAVAQRAAELESWLQHLIDANGIAGIYPETEFRREILWRFRRLCRLINGYGKDGWSRWHGASILRGGIWRGVDYLVFPLWYRRRMMSVAGKE